MLSGIDKALAPLTWIVAGVLVLMLFAGPQVVAEDKAEPERAGEAAGAAPYAAAASGSSSAGDGKVLFTDTCGSCHALSKAGTSGDVGPPLDDVGLEAAGIESVVREGRGTMPSFAGELADDEITAIAAFVAGG